MVSHEIHEGDVAILGDRIAGIGRYRADRTIDLKGRYLCPGLIDAHVHIESSMLCVPEFSRVVVACGTTAVVADPHEFANVMGTAGISYVLRTAKNGPIDVYIMLSSCVPASSLETAGAELTAEDLEPFLANPWVLGLAEMMNYPGVIAAAPDVLSKIDIAADRVVDGQSWLGHHGRSTYPRSPVASSRATASSGCPGSPPARPHWVSASHGRRPGCFRTALPRPADRSLV